MTTAMLHNACKYAVQGWQNVATTMFQVSTTFELEQFSTKFSIESCRIGFVAHFIPDIKPKLYCI